MKRGPRGATAPWRAMAACLAVIGTMLLVSACGGGDDGGDAKPAPSEGGAEPAAEVGKGKTIGIIAQGDNVFNNCYTTGALKGLEGTGYETEILTSNFDPNQEIANFQSLVAKGVAGIVVFPSTAQSAGRGALEAQRAKIPVVNAAWNAPSAGDKAYVGRLQINSETGAKLTAEWIAENTEPGEVLLINGGVGDPTDNAFVKAFKTELKPGWDLVGVQGGEYSRDKAITAAENLFTAHPDAKIVVDFAAEMGNGVASWLSRNKKDDVVHITNDGNAEMSDWIEKGFITADRFYSSAEEGLEGVKLLRKQIEQGEATPGLGQTYQAMVTKDNLAETLEAHPLCYDEHLDEARAAK
jgi:ribose transport system substrate-binding protein